MKRLLPWLLTSIGFGVMLALANLPLSIGSNFDFNLLYNANMGLLRGIPLYDHTGQVQMIADLAGVPPEAVILHPFPYPPWYALITLPLALLPDIVAARMWMEINIALLLISIWLMTDGWPPKKRLLSFPIALLFLPTLGAWLVGQYVFPVLLGLALLTYALRHKNSVLTALGLTLLTFKPHLGGLVLMAVLLHLWLNRDDFAKRALKFSAAASIFLFAIGFLADPAWPINYFYSITKYGKISGVQTCNLCISLPVMLTGGIGASIWVAGLLLISFLCLIYWKRKLLWNQLSLVTVFTLGTLLVSPYLLNYDFVLLLVPMLFVAGSENNRCDWLILGTSYLLPWFWLGVFGRQGNPVLLVSALGLTLLTWKKSRNNL